MNSLKVRNYTYEPKYVAKLKACTYLSIILYVEID